MLCQCSPLAILLFQFISSFLLQPPITGPSIYIPPISRHPPDALLQIVRYCSNAGIKYAMLSCWWFTWAVAFEGNDIKVSTAFPWNSMQPTISGVR